MKKQTIFLILTVITILLILFQTTKFSFYYPYYVQIYSKLLEEEKVPNVPSYYETRNIYEVKILDYIKKWNISFKNTKLQNHIHLLNYTHELMVLEQVLPPFNKTERSVPLKDQLNCSNKNFSSFLTGNARNSSANIIDVIIFGYELLTLEIRLFELFEAVDEFIIFESNVTFKNLWKPLFFYNNKYRYKKFLHKITLISPFNIMRFNLDGSIKFKTEIRTEDVLNEFKTPPKLDFSAEEEKKYYIPDFGLEKKYRNIPMDIYKKYLREFNSNDILIHGDVDEIIDGNIANHFKYCDVKQDLYPFLSWSHMFMYNFRTLFQSDFPVAGDIHSFKCPSVFIYQNYVDQKVIRFGKGTILPEASGCHLNRFLRTLALGIYKGMSQSDSGGIADNFMNILNTQNFESFDKFSEIMIKNMFHKQYEGRTQSLESLRNKKVFIPWIVSENRDVYQNWLV